MEKDEKVRWTDKMGDKGVPEIIRDRERKILKSIRKKKNN